jgi:hypothetical protein
LRNAAMSPPGRSTACDRLGRARGPRSTMREAWTIFSTDDGRRLRWGGSNVSYPHIVYRIRSFDPVGVDGFCPDSWTDRQPGNEASHVHAVHDRRDMASCFRLRHALVWDRPKQWLCLSPQHRPQRDGYFRPLYPRQRDDGLTGAIRDLGDRQGLPRRRVDNFRLLQPRSFLHQLVANVGFALALRRWEQTDWNPGVDLPEMQERRRPGSYLGIPL